MGNRGNMITISYFYPRPPRGGRPKPQHNIYGCKRFLSTPSARRATGGAGNLQSGLVISIHALREEGDPCGFLPYQRGKHFYPRPPRGGRPDFSFFTTCPFHISIHALREEGDINTVISPVCPVDFYPRPPRGGRLAHTPTLFQPLQFLSTPSARRATAFIRSTGSPKGYFYPRPPRGGRQQKQRKNTLLLS